MRSILVQHDGSIWVGGTHLQVSDALIATTRDAAILCSQLLNPIVSCSILLAECFAFLLRERGGKLHRDTHLLLLNGLARCFCLGSLLIVLFIEIVGFDLEEVCQMCFDGKTRLE